MSRAIPSASQQNLTAAFSNRGTLDAYAQQKYGMNAKTLEVALNALMSVSQGRMPSPDGMKFVLKSARDQLGWSETRTRAELSKAISAGSPEQRLAAYATANGHKRVSDAEFAQMSSLVQQGLRADIESSIQNRLSESTSVNAADRRFDGMEAAQRVLDDTANRQDVRTKLDYLMGANKPTGFEAKRDAVIKARTQLADRVELKGIARAKGYEPSLRESLSDTYDLKAVSEASKEYGLGDPEATAAASIADTAHTEEDFDVTSGLPD